MLRLDFGEFAGLALIVNQWLTVRRQARGHLRALDHLMRPLAAPLPPLAAVDFKRRVRRPVKPIVPDAGKGKPHVAEAAKTFVNAPLAMVQGVHLGRVEGRKKPRA